MKAEKYVKQIVRRLKCSGKKRREIQRQLLADIEAEMSDGETLESILKRMGDAKEAAAEFNQNMSGSEQKGYIRERRGKICAAAVLIICLLAAFVYWLLPRTKEIAQGDVFSTETVEEKAKDVVLLLDKEDYDSLKAMAIEEMEEFLTPENLDGVREQVAKDCGAFRQFGNVYMTEVEQQGKKYAVVELTAAYENTNITYTISFDEDMKLAGLYMK